MAITPRRFLVVSVLLFVLGLPGVASAQLATTCDASLWDHVYHPGRLVQIHPCIRVTGTIPNRYRRGKTTSCPGCGPLAGFEVTLYGRF